MTEYTYDVVVVGAGNAALCAALAAREQGAKEAWFVDKSGHVTEGSSSNAWIVTRDGKVITRQVDHGILKGITRTVVLEQGGTGWEKIQSLFSAIRMWGGSIATAYSAQAVLGLVLVTTLVWLWRSPARFELKAAALVIASLLVTPALTSGAPRTSWDAKPCGRLGGTLIFSQADDAVSLEDQSARDDIVEELAVVADQQDGAGVFDEQVFEHDLVLAGNGHGVRLAIVI